MAGLMTSRQVVLCLVDPQNDFQQLLLAEAQAAARRASLELVAHFSGHELMAQLKQIQSALDGAPRPAAVLVMAIRDPALLRVTRDALQKGIAWIFLNRTEGDLEPLRREFPGVPLSTVCVDEVETGRIQGRQARELRSRGRILYVQGSSRSLAARDRSAGMQEAIAGSGLELAGVDGSWTTASAHEAVRSWLRIAGAGKAPVDLIACQNDAMALGALAALAEASAALGRPELARIPVLGCDGTVELGQKLVREGRLQATVVLPRPGAAAVNWVALWLVRRQAPPGLDMLAAESYPPLGSLPRS
jgi:ABC-type sugar transport system substrate-binding protein